MCVCRYVRMNRNRLKGIKGTTQDDRFTALSVLFEVMFTLTKLMAPFTPFLVDQMYQNLKNALPVDQQGDSVHYLFIPEVLPEAFDAKIETAVARMQQVVDMGRMARDARKISLKMPINEVVILTTNAEYLDSLQSMEFYIKEELNCRSVRYLSDTGDFAKLEAVPDRRVLGKKLGKKLRAVDQEIQKLDAAAINGYLESGSITVLGEEILAGEIQCNTKFIGDAAKYVCVC